MSKQVVIYGRDKTLVETRRILLEKAGYSAGTVTDNQAVNSLLASGEVRLLVLCSSLPGDEADRALALSHSTAPACQNLRVSTRNGDTLDRSHADTSFYAFDGPAGFVRQVKSLLEH